MDLSNNFSDLELRKLLFYGKLSKKVENNLEFSFNER